MPNSNAYFAMPEVVVFDVFGTLLRIGDRKHPFLKLMKLARNMGRRPTPDDARILMCEDLGLAAAAQRFEVEVTLSQLAELEHDLLCELGSIKLYSDSLPAIRILQNAGISVAVCSNLAAPYALPVMLLLPHLDAYSWSFRVGAVKPERAIYEQVSLQLNCPLSNMVMIGDTLEADCLGPRRFGMRGFHLNRSGRADVDTFADLTSFSQFLLKLHRRT